MTDFVTQHSAARSRTALREFGRLIEAELMAMNLATNDALTGVPNLRGFLEIGNHVLALSTRCAHSLQLLVVKIARLAGAADFCKGRVGKLQSAATRLARGPHRQGREAARIRLAVLE